MTYCSTPRALHPWAVAIAMPCREQYSESMWSWPIVAVAINPTGVPPSNRSSQCVRVRTTRASARAASQCEISLP